MKIYNLKAAFYTLVLLALLSGFFLGIGVGSSHLAYDLNRFVLFIFLFICCSVFLFGDWRFSSIGSSKAWIGFFVFLFSAITSDWLNVSSKYQLVNLSFFSLFFFVIAGSVTKFPDRGFEGFSKFALLALIVVSDSLLLLMFLLWAAEGFSNQIANVVLNSGFVNINYFGHLLTWLIPIHVLVCVGFAKKGFYLLSAIVFFFLVFSWWFIFQLSIRGSLFSIVISFLFLMLVFRKRAFMFVMLGFASGFLAFSISLAFQFLVAGFEGDIYHSVSSADSSGRLILWREAVLMSLQSFPFGMGSESWVTHSFFFENIVPERAFGHPHNMVLLWAAEFGWLSVFGIFLVVMAGIEKILHYKSVLGKSESRDIFVLAMVSSTVAGVVHGGVSAMFLVPASMVVGMVVIFITFGALSSADQPVINLTAYKIMSFGRRGLSGVLLFVFLAFSLAELHSYYLGMSEDKKRYVAGGPVKMSPRFWAHGYAPDIPGSYQSPNLDPIMDRH